MLPEYAAALPMIYFVLAMFFIMQCVPVTDIVFYGNLFS